MRKNIPDHHTVSFDYKISIEKVLKLATLYKNKILY